MHIFREYPVFEKTSFFYDFSEKTSKLWYRIDYFLSVKKLIGHITNAGGLKRSWQSFMHIFREYPVFEISSKFLWFLWENLKIEVQNRLFPIGKKLIGHITNAGGLKRSWQNFMHIFREYPVFEINSKFLWF